MKSRTVSLTVIRAKMSFKTFSLANKSLGLQGCILFLCTGWKLTFENSVVDQYKRAQQELANLQYWILFGIYRFEAKVKVPKNLRFLQTPFLVITK